MKYDIFEIEKLNNIESLQEQNSYKSTSKGGGLSITYSGGYRCCGEQAQAW